MKNKHLIDLITEFPKLHRQEIAKALGVPSSTFCHWTNKNEQNRKEAPEWTKNIVQSARQKLIATCNGRFEPVTQLSTVQPAAITDPLFIVAVPSSKVTQFKGVVAMFSGSIVDM